MTIINLLLSRIIISPFVYTQGSVVTGSMPRVARYDFPRYYPSFCATHLNVATDVGFTVISQYGQCYLPDKEFRYLRTVYLRYTRLRAACALHIAMEIGLYHHLQDRRRPVDLEMLGV